MNKTQLRDRLDDGRGPEFREGWPRQETAA